MIAAARTRFAAALLCALAWWLTAPPASASGIASPLIGTPWSGVTTADAAAVHWNPAMLADLDGFRLQLAGGLIVSRIAYERERRALYQYEDGFDFKLPLAEHDLDPSKTGWADPVESWGALPSGTIFASYQMLPDRLTLGLGVYSAYAAVLKLPDEGPHMWQIQEAFVLGLYVTPAIAWRVTDWLQVGVGGSLVLGGMAMRQVTDLATTDLLSESFANPPINQANDFGADAPPSVRELSVLSRPVTINQATAIGWSFNAGVTVTPIDMLRIAIAYQYGSDLVFEGDAHLDMNHDFFTQDLAVDGLQYPAIVRGKAYVELPFPMALRFGLAVTPIEALTLHLQASWVRWSVIETMRVTMESEDLVQEDLGLGSVTTIELPRHWNDTAEIELLTTYDLDEDLRLGLRLGYHSPSSPDATVDLSSIDGHRLIAALMARYQATENVALDGFVQLHQLIPRHVVASDHDRGNGIYELTLLAFGGSLDLAF